MVGFLNLSSEYMFGGYMNKRMVSNVGLLMGTIILVADIIWMYITHTTYTTPYSSYYAYQVNYTPLALGVIIFIADLIWIYADLLLRRE